MRATIQRTTIQKTLAALSMWAVLLSTGALIGCSDNAEDPAAKAAAAQKLFETEYEPVRKEYLVLLAAETEASKKVIPLRVAAANAKAQGSESKHAELKAEYDSAVADWNSAKKAFEAKQVVFTNLKAKLQGMGFDFAAAKK